MKNPIKDMPPIAKTAKSFVQLPLKFADIIKISVHSCTKFSSRGTYISREM
jgi:hypothetical protein